MTSRLASLLTDGQGTVVVHHTKAQQQLSRHRNATQGPPTCRFWSEQRCPQPNRDRSTKASAKLYMQHMHIRFDWTGHARTTDVRDVLRECVFTSMIHIYIYINRPYPMGNASENDPCAFLCTVKIDPKNSSLSVKSTTCWP